MSSAPREVTAQDLSPEMLAQAAAILNVSKEALLNDPGCSALTASAAPIKPPRDWFEKQEPDEPTPVTITADGQVYGHLALWESCHTGFLSSSFSECIRPPRSESGYQFFNLGGIETDDGAIVAAGKLTYGGGHAPLALGMQAAADHYDKTSTVGAFVRASDGKHGIWLTGALRSDITPEGVRDMRANPPSGDWRPHRHGLELTAALAVPVQGFPVPRSQLALSASGISALILPGLSEDDLMEPRSKEFLRRRHSLSSLVATARSDAVSS
jgi:hypothetical protein